MTKKITQILIMALGAILLFLATYIFIKIFSPKLLILGLGAVLSLYGTYLCVRLGMWAYYKFF